jgi:hypothetical protein
MFMFGPPNVQNRNQTFSSRTQIPQGKAFPDKLIVSQLVKKSTLYVTQKLITVFKKVLLSPRSVQSILLPQTLVFYSELLDFRTLFIALYSKNYKTQRFGSWISSNQ